jgi:transcriptional regulator with XRE-family HTH domain
MKNPHQVDRLVGERLRLARLNRGLSQTKLADALGITFQQVQKYERGSNRISAGRLFDAAEFLGVEIAWFFGGATGEKAGEGVGESIDLSFLGRSELEALQNLPLIKDPAVKRSVILVIRALVAGERAEGEPDNGRARTR